MPQQITLFECGEDGQLQIPSGGGAYRIGRKLLNHTYNEIISLENLCLAWEEFIVGKKRKQDIQQFAYRLMDNIVELHESLVNHMYAHGGYESFIIHDPKRRHIHKASVRDRLLHHAVYRKLYPFFDRTFIADSFSCRDGKGTHKALDRFQRFAFQAGKNHTRTVLVLKCDIRKFFGSIDQSVLMGLLCESIQDQNILRLLENIIKSYHTEFQPGVGLPLGNLTSQLFANVYLDRFDQWVKHRLKVKYYIRYADDFVFLSDARTWLTSVLPCITSFLQEELHLLLHPDKVFLKTVASGVDYLGWVHFSEYCVLRASTRRRMLKRLRFCPTEATLQSYFGLLSHGNTERLRKDVVVSYWLWQ